MHREQAKRNLTSLLTNRPKAVKALEDTYGVKYQQTSMKTAQKSPPKSAITPVMSFKDRGDMDCSEPLPTYRPNYNKYLITASDRYTQPLPTARRRGVTFSQNSASSTLLEERHAEVLSKQEQYFSKTENETSMRPNTPKASKSVRSNHGGSERAPSYMGNSPKDNFIKNDIISFEDDDIIKKKHDHHRHHQHQRESHAHEHFIEEKDDTEEFIALIRHEIEKSVVKSISEKMNSTFAEINKKIDRQAAEIKKVTSAVQKIHTSLSNKISHYGEENSRHFRYLCMKSEYDKMFYQHQNDISVKSAPTTPSESTKGSCLSGDQQSKKRNCTISSARTLVPEQPNKTTFDENMREMVGQLKKFCLQYEASAVVEEDFNDKSGTSGSSGLHINNAYENCNSSFPDEANFSSDGMTPRSVENESLLMDRKCSGHEKSGNILNLLNKGSLGGGDD